jgi:hypothetical protein
MKIVDSERWIYFGQHLAPAENGERRWNGRKDMKHGNCRVLSPDIR